MIINMTTHLVQLLQKYEVAKRQFYERKRIAEQCSKLPYDDPRRVDLMDMRDTAAMAEAEMNNSAIDIAEYLLDLWPWHEPKERVRCTDDLCR